MSNLFAPLKPFEGFSQLSNIVSPCIFFNEIKIFFLPTTPIIKVNVT